MSLVFPDVNVWLALASEEHTRHRVAFAWWQQQEDAISFCRFTQIGLLRLLTTSVVMNGKPLAMRQAWKVYDTFLSDERVDLVSEPAPVERMFREFSSSASRASPKLWADAYLIAFAAESGGMLVTFDQTLAHRGHSILLT